MVCSTDYNLDYKIFAMAITKIQYTDKDDYEQNPLAEQYKVVANDMNEIKRAINALIDAVALLRKPTILTITSANFSGSNYTNSKLVNKTANVDFMVYSNSGSGVLLKPSDGYDFSTSLGRITADPDNYIILIYEAVS